MAHWDDERDRRRAKEMRECKLPGTEEVIQNYEETGDIVYWAQFCALIGKYLRARKVT